MKLILVTLFFCFCYDGFSQGESIGPITSTGNQTTVKKRTDSFDSTFIYNPDILSLPLYDDFSRNHFQKYVKDYTDVTLTSAEEFHLLDINDVVLPASTRYTSQQTIWKKINVAELTVTDSLLPSVSIKVGSLASWPVTYVPTNVYPPYIIYDTLDFPNPLDTIWLDPVEYVQDSATQFFVDLNDPNSFWLDTQATHNYTNAKLPWSLGVVTFDGLNSDGFPYIFGSTANDYNDYLTSKPIDLSGNTPSDSIFLSFMYQTQGFNDEPESTDSLALEMYAPNLNQWFQVWSTSGAPVGDFKKVHLRIIDVKFFQQKFQFRFKNYGSVAGAIDEFHIDYVNLRSGSNYLDTTFNDLAIVYPIKTLLKEYTQVPWDHYKNSPAGKMTDVFDVTMRHTKSTNSNVLDGVVSVDYQGANEGSFVLIGSQLAGTGGNYIANSFNTSYHDFSAGYQFDPSKTGDAQVFDVTMGVSSQFGDDPINDTTFYKQCFFDSYAYDDGSAEAAYGPTGVQARLAYQFTPYEADSLVGVKIKFVPSVNNVSTKLFLLTVWDDNNGQPGNVLYQDDFLDPKQPDYNYDDTNGFKNYYLNDFMKLPISGTFYVGWRQIDQDRLNVGMDMNIDNSDKIFYSINNEETWNVSAYDGSLLMRPIFSTALNKKLTLSELVSAPKNEFKIYPNPSSNTITIQSDEANYTGVEIIDLQGKIHYVSTANERTIDVSSLANGIYLIKDIHSNAVVKLVKN